MREGWSYKKLGELATFINGYPFKPSDWKDCGRRIIRIQNLNNPKALYNYYDGDIDAKYLVSNGDVLISWSGSLGVFEWSEDEAILNQHIFKVVFNKGDINKRFFEYVVSSRINEMTTKVHGITMQHITKRDFDVIPIPIPPLSEQQRIVNELDLLSSIIEKKKAQLKEYDQLAQSIFYDMFGDPIENPKGWEVKKLGEVCKKITDGTHDTPQRLEKGVKFITGKHIRPFLVDYDNSDYVTEEVHKEIFQRCNPELGDVLYTNIGAGIGNAAINTVEYEFSMKNVALLKPLRSIVNGYFLEFYLNNDKIKTIIIDNYSNGGAQKFLSLKSIAKITVPLPPLSLQQSFAEKIEAIEKQ